MCVVFVINSMSYTKWEGIGKSWTRLESRTGHGFDTPGAYETVNKMYRPQAQS